MQKDYAKYTFKQNNQLVEHGWRYRLFIVISVISVICIIGYSYYLYNKYPGSFHLSKIKSFFVHKENKVNPTTIVAKQEKKQEESEIHFNFYTELPKGQVTVSTPEFHEPIAKPLLATQENNSKKGQYLLQVAAFKNVSAAGETRISLLFAGFEVDIVKSMTNDNELIYLLQQGPYPSLAQAKSAQQQMKQKGIESVVKKIT